MQHSGTDGVFFATREIVKFFLVDWSNQERTKWGKVKSEEKLS